MCELRCMVSRVALMRCIPRDRLKALHCHLSYPPLSAVLHALFTDVPLVFPFDVTAYAVVSDAPAADVSGGAAEGKFGTPVPAPRALVVKDGPPAPLSARGGGGTGGLAGSSGGGGAGSAQGGSAAAGGGSGGEGSGGDAGVIGGGSLGASRQLKAGRRAWADQAGTLLPPPRLPTGRTSVSIYIDKIGLKDAPRYANPHIAVYVVDSDSTFAGPEQLTPVATAKSPTYLTYKSAVHLQVPLEAIADGTGAVVLEFRHWKEKEGYVSTRCWAVMSKAELASGCDQPVCLELYQKPVDLSLKKLKLYTEKDLFLHVTVRFVKY